MQTNAVQWNENYCQWRGNEAELKSMLFWAKRYNQNKSKQKQTRKG